MQGNRARLVLSSISIWFFFAPGLALAGAGQALEGQLLDGAYTSPSGKLQCDLGEYAASPGFFLNEAYDPNESETLSFGLDAGTHIEVWTIRRQREGRVEFAPLINEGFPVNSKSFIPYFYSELPYEIESLENLEPSKGRSEIIRVQMGDQVQLHGYWLDLSGKWLNSIQFLPTLASSEEYKLEKRAVKDALEKLKGRCTFR